MDVKTGSIIAVKQITLKSVEQQQHARQLQTEIDLLKSLQHPNVVKLLSTERCDGLA